MIPREPGIYKIVNNISGGSYVGSAASLRNRWSVHRHSLSRGTHHNTQLQRAWKKYGSESFSFHVIEFINDKKELLQREQFWMDKMRSNMSIYNELTVAGSSLGRKFSPETLAKMSAKGKQRIFTDETRLRMSESSKPMSPEHKAKIIAECKARTGMKASDEAKKNMSESAKVRVATKSIRGSDGRFK